jgi:acyl-CoA synthetase (AMP-forming)/AMP-acid ligase II
MTFRPETWPTYPDELLPNTLFKLAAQYPDLTYSEYPRSKDVADGFRKITYKEVANAVHAVAWWIEENVGKPAVDDGSETLVYMGPGDLRYALLVLGSVMIGYKVCLILSIRDECSNLMYRCSSQRPDTAQNLSRSLSQV